MPTRHAQPVVSVPSVAATAESPVVECAAGCTDGCPGERDGHSFELCQAHAARVNTEWNSVCRRDSGETLPPGWVREARLRDYEVGDVDMDLLRVPSRVVARPVGRLLSRPEQAVGVGGTLAGCWVLVRRNHRVNVAQVIDHETNLWRLYGKVRLREDRRPVNPFDEPDKSVADWLAGLVARHYDPADPAQSAEAMLYALSGQFRTPPPSTLLRP